jgi:amino acid adenylation domain-containing protein
MEIRNNILNYRLRYHRSNTDETIINNFIKHYRSLFNLILQDLRQNQTNKLLNDYQILDETEYSNIVYNSNITKKYSQSHTIHQLFEKQVTKNPDNTAVIYENIAISYHKLNSDANQLANYLRNQYTFKPDNLIAVCLERSELVIVSILGVLKSGSAYVPIDVNNPDDRIGHILVDTKIKLIICQENYKSKLKRILKKNTIKAKLIVLDDNTTKCKITLCHQQNLDLPIHSKNLSYIIYTSGTTGVPKGVLQQHNNVCQLFFATQKMFIFSDKDTWTMFHSYAFDFSVWEIWGALLNGARLVIPNHYQITNPDTFLDFCLKWDVTVLNQTPTAFYQFMSCVLKKPNKLTNLRYIIFGGEKLEPLKIKSWFDVYDYNHPQMINMYGITETTVHTTYKQIKPEEINYRSNIGWRIPDQKLFILDNLLQPVPIGVIGELYIGGGRLARGYLNLPELTTKKFIPSPYSNKHHNQNVEMRLYRTGDLVRRLHDNSLEYIGRADNQVKVRGFRIELSEIESQLLNFSSIKQAIIVPRQMEHDKLTTTLVAYYVAEYKLDETKIRDYLANHLPEYMIPSNIIHMNKFPLNINGKLDYNLLPQPHTSLPNNNQLVYTSNLEQIICHSAARVLELPNDSILPNDNFFKLGGNSIAAIRFMNDMLSHKIKIDLADILQCPTIGDLTHHVHDNISKGIAKLNISNTEEYQLSFAQERMYFIEQSNKNTDAYNMSLVIKLAKSCKLDVMLNSVCDLILRHEVLRTIIKKTTHTKFYQLVTDTLPEINHQLINSEAELFTQMKLHKQKLFDLENECPVRIYHYECLKVNYILFVIHHIACDGWSIDILKRDLIHYYQHNLGKKISSPITAALPILDIQYKDFALWQRKYMQLKFQQQLEHWKKKLDNFEMLSLPTDHNRPTVFNYHGNTIKFKLPRQLSTQLKLIAVDLKVSLYSLLLSGFYLLMRIFSHQNDILIGTVISNRHYKDIENLVGFFVNMVALRHTVNAEQNLFEYIKLIHSEVLDLHSYQDLPFDLLIKELQLEANPSMNPLFQVVFIVQDFGKYYKSDLFESLDYIDSKTAKFDMSFIINDSLENIEITIEYATSIFNKDTIVNYFKTYRIILEQFGQFYKNSKQKYLLSDIKYVNNTQLSLINSKLNGRKSRIPNKTIHQLFEEQVRKTPNQIAIIYENVSISYQELNKLSNQLAHYLVANYGLITNDLVAICLDRSQYVVIAILAILKTGAAYVPIDLDYPNDRIKYILSNTRAKLLITNNIYFNRFNQLCDHIDVKVVAINNNLGTLTQYLDTDLSYVSSQQNLAYVIYTSGTTGTPKGVMINHRSVVNLIKNIIDIHGLSKYKLVGCYSNFVFDAFVYELFPGLCCGCTIFIVPTQTRHDIQQLANYYQKNGITTSFIPTALMNHFIQLAGETKLKIIYTGGDTLNLSSIATRVKPSYQIINEYGVTEATVCSTYFNVKDIFSKQKCCIGSPIDNVECMVLNEQQLPVPIGAIGELFIGGSGLAKGYLNLPKLTKEKFVKYKIGSLTKRFYKTGDLVKLLSNGMLEYHRRNDSQVKIRGFRIELGEIKSVIDNYPGVKQSAVVVIEENNDKHQSIVGYYVKEMSLQDKDISNYLNNWQQIYDLNYDDMDSVNYKYNFTGWKSSYTHKNIAQIEMLAWLHDTIDKIRHLKPKHILEIGCGTGLIMFNILEYCQKYYATDFSQQSINNINYIINKNNYTDKVITKQYAANEIPYNNIGMVYDTVIVNSVIQYFPTLDYLEEILIRIIENITPQGKIFLGDIRDYRLIDVFHHSIIKFKQTHTSIGEVCYMVTKEKELLVSPGYFIGLKNRNSNIKIVEILPKFFDYNNEISIYRYDVVLHIDKTDSKSKLIKVSYSKFLNNNFNTQTNQIMANNALDDTVYFRYPNKRIIHHYHEYAQLTNIETNLNYIQYSTILSINELITSLESDNYNAKIMVDAIDPLSLIIIASKEKSLDLNNIVVEYLENSVKVTKIANNPLFNIEKINEQKNNLLLEYLKQKLPEYMVPSHLILVNEIPLTLNGKLDKKSLPRPMYRNYSLNYIAPRNEWELHLSNIFHNILGRESFISIFDNFFEIGGNSILAIQLVLNINKTFGTNLKLSDVFVNSTIENLSNILQKIKHEFQLLTCLHLNISHGKKNIFMIHPASSGVEVYTKLAQILSLQYNCYGVDNYNLHNNDKIINLNQLANKYLLSIKDCQKNAGLKYQDIILLGWSLGGQIALEISAILEQQGIYGIKLVLLDAIVPNKIVVDYLVKTIKFTNPMQKILLEKGHLAEYVTKVTNNFLCENKIARQRPSRKLKYTHILLFKAGKTNTTITLDIYDKIRVYMHKLKYNNIDTTVEITNLKLIRLAQATHDTILEESEYIVNELQKWFLEVR